MPASDSMIDALASAFLPDAQHAEASSSATSAASTRVKLNAAIKRVLRPKGEHLAQWTASEDVTRAKERIHSIATKHQLHLQPGLARALTAAHSALEKAIESEARLAVEGRQLQAVRRKYEERARAAGAEWDPAGLRREVIVDDPLINSQNVGDVLALLLRLSRPPSADTYAHVLSLDTSEPTLHARLYLTPEECKVAERNEWDRILQAEPLEWELGEERRDELDRMGDSLSEWSSEDGEEELDGLDGNTGKQGKKVESGQSTRELKLARKQRVTAPGVDESQHQQLILGELASRRAAAYWEQRSASPSKSFNLHDVTSISSLDEQARQRRHISELHALREVLLALDGFPSILFSQANDGQVTGAKNAPCVRHLSPGTFQVLLSRFARLASVLANLRRVAAHFIPPADAGVASTSRAAAARASLRAFGAQLQLLLHDLSSRFATRDAEVGAALVRASVGLGHSNRDEAPCFTLQDLLRTAEDEAATLLLLHDLIESMELAKRPATEEDSTRLLDALHTAVRFETSLARSTGKDASEGGVDAEALAHCFVAAAAPTWDLVRTWLVRGMDLTYHAPAADGATTYDDPPFLHRSNLPATDARFWGAVHHVRPTGSEGAPPRFLSEMAHDIATAGKSVGLLRAFGRAEEMPLLELLQGDEAALEHLLRPQLEEAADERHDSSSLDSDDESGIEPLSDPPIPERQLKALALPVQDQIRAVLFGEHLQPQPSASPSTTSLVQPQSVIDPRPLSPPHSPVKVARSNMLSRALDDGASAVPSGSGIGSVIGRRLKPVTAVVRRRLNEIILSPADQGGCDLSAHIAALHGVYLMRRGDDMRTLLEALFQRIDAGQDLKDSQLLDTTFREETGAEVWCETALVRFRVDMSRLAPGVVLGGAGGGVRALSCINVDYELRWPLCYFLTPDVQACYQALFTWLLQLARAQHVLARLTILIRPSTLMSRSRLLSAPDGAAEPTGAVPHAILNSASDEMRRFQGLRTKLVWITRVLTEWISRDIIEVRSQALQESLPNQASLDDLLSAHASTLHGMHDMCFLAPAQAELHSTMLDCLDLAAHASEYLCAYAGIDDTEGEAYEDAQGSAASEAAKRRNRRRRARRAKRAKRRAREMDETDDEEEEELATSSTVPSSEPVGAEEAEKMDVHDVTVGGTTTFASMSMSFLEATSFEDRVTALDEELDANLAALHRGVEKLVAQKSNSGSRADWEVLQSLAYEFQAVLG